VAGECNCLRIDPRLREAPRGGTLLSSICKTQKRSRGKNGNASEAYAWHLPLSECLKCMANTGEECFLPSVLSECLKCMANTGEECFLPSVLSECLKCMANTGEECFLPSVLSECLKCMANTGEECFLPSVLLCVRPGATLFEDLRTAHNQIHPTFQAAAQALQCCGPFTGVYKAMGDARCTGMPAQL